MTFGTALRQRRQQAGIPQFEVAHRAGIALRTYVRWEADEIEPRISEFLRVAEVLAVDPGSFLHDITPQPAAAAS